MFAAALGCTLLGPRRRGHVPGSHCQDRGRLLTHRALVQAARQTGNGRTLIERSLSGCGGSRPSVEVEAMLPAHRRSVLRAGATDSGLNDVLAALAIFLIVVVSPSPCFALRIDPGVGTAKTYPAQSRWDAVLRRARPCATRDAAGRVGSDGRVGTGLVVAINALGG